MRILSWHRRTLTVLPLAILLAAFTFYAQGAYTSLSCDGSSQYVTVSNSPSLTPTPLTFEAWVNPNTAECNTILSRGDGGNGSATDYIFDVGYDGSTCGVMKVGFFGVGGWDSSTSTISLNTWTHVAVTFDGTHKQFYINGVLDTNALRSGSLFKSANSVMYIGRQGTNCNCNYFHGFLSEVRVWNTVRTVAQIAADMNFSTGSQSGLVAYYHLNEGSGTVANDASGNGHTGVVQESSGWANSEPPLQSLGASTFVEGPAAGTNSVLLQSPNETWTASTNASWLHLSAGYQSGTGSTNVVFSFDANTGATRTGTITIAGLPLTITQAGTNYIPANPLTTVVSGLSSPKGVAVDGTGNVFFTDYGNNVLKKWSVTNNTVTTLISSGLNGPYNVALDGAGNAYVADFYNQAIKKWTATNGVVTTLVSVLSPGAPQGVAVDGAGNVYIADFGNNAIEEWVAVSNSLITLVSGLSGPNGVAVDTLGNVYFSEEGSTVGIYEWNAATRTVSTIASGGFGGTDGVAVDGAGNVYFDEVVVSSTYLEQWSPVSKTITTLISSGLASPSSMALDGSGNIYISDQNNKNITELPKAFVLPTVKFESNAAGSDSLPAVVPATQNLLAPFAPTSNQPWLTISGVANGVVSFSFTTNSGATRTANITLLGQQFPVTQSGVTALGTTNRLEGPAAGADSVVLAAASATTAWAATNNNTSWLHLSAGYQSGTGSTNVIFSFDANAGSTRTGSVTIAGITVAVIQAGSTYVSAPAPLTAIVSSGLNNPLGVAVDGAANVYFSDAGNYALKEWSPASNSVTTLVANPAVLGNPAGVALDSAGDVYVADTPNNAIKEWSAVSKGVSTVVSSGSEPYGVGLDPAGNIYFVDVFDNSLRELVAASNSVTLLTRSLSAPYGMAVDIAGNVYTANYGTGEILEWNSASQTTNGLFNNGIDNLWGVAVDGAGNIYFSDFVNGAIKELSAANQSVTTLVSSGLRQPKGVAVDGAGNVYIANSISNAIDELPRAFVNPTPKYETNAAGSDVLPVVLPSTANLTNQFAPTTDQPWLTISGVANGVVSFSFAANTGQARMGNIIVLGEKIPVTQFGAVSFLSTTNRLEGPAAGMDSVILSSVLTSWTATTNATWLHLGAGYQSGTTSTNVVFSFDANPGITRTGTLTIAGRTLTITQAGSTYVPASPTVLLVTNGLNYPYGMAVDGQGNVYFADSGNNAVKEWTAANNTVTTLVSSGLNNPVAVAVDGQGNVYIADMYNNAIKKWTAGTGDVTTLVSSGLSYPDGVALDILGNVYIADSAHNAVKEWLVASNSVITVVSGTGLASSPQGIAVDAAGDIFYTYNSGSYAIMEWSAASQTATPLVDVGLLDPDSVAVDLAGNVYIADSANNVMKKWVAANSTVYTLFSGSSPSGVAADSTGDVFSLMRFPPNYVQELAVGYVDPTPKFESSAAGGSDVLPVILTAPGNLLGPLGPTSNEPWLTITGVTNGVVSFSFSANSGPGRIGNITVLGQQITVTQSGVSALAATNRVEGPASVSDSVVLASLFTPWTATTNAPWLHLSAGYQSGTTSTNVVFTLDANPGPTRSGTLTIGGQTLTVTQAGSTYVTATPLTTLVSSGQLNNPIGVAADSSGNVYIADYNNNAIKEWTPANNLVTTLVSSGLNGPHGVAVDGLGNVYIADSNNGAIKEWVAASNTVITLVSGLSGPEGVAIDGAGNVYIGEYNNSDVKEWIAANNTVITLIPSGVGRPSAVAVDAAGNVYDADPANYQIHEWSLANRTVSTLAGSIYNSQGVAVDSGGNVYFPNNSVVDEWSAGSHNFTPLTLTPGSSPQGVAVDAGGNIYVADMNNGIEELGRGFVDPTAMFENNAASSDVLPIIFTAPGNLLGPLGPTSNQPWLTITGVTNGVVGFSFSANSGQGRTASISVLGQQVIVRQAGVSALAATNRLEGAAAGMDSVVVASLFTSWTATNNASWLHVSPGYQSGTGSTNVIFSFDANPGPTRTGTLTIGGQTLTVTQAGSTYVPATQLATLVSGGLNYAEGVAVDGSGNVYIVDRNNAAIKEWTAANNTVTTLVSSGLNLPIGVAVDGQGNVYITDNANGALEEWVAASNIVNTLVSGLNQPGGVALDSAGDVYFGENGGDVKEWIAASNTVVTLVSSGMGNPYAMALDGAGNVYVADFQNGAIKEWSPANNSIVTLVSGIAYPQGVALDSAGNVYFSDASDDTIKEWSATNHALITLASTIYNPTGVSLDAAGNVYFVNNLTSISELARAYVDTTTKLEGAAAGSDVLPVVLPATENLAPPFAPTTDQPWWLTYSGATNGVVSFSFGANSSGGRSANLSVLGQQIAIRQSCITALGASNRLEGPASGMDSIVVSSLFTPWTATNNASWLHVGPGYQSGTSSTNVVFSFDANPGPTRSGTLTIGGQTLTVTQAGSTYVPASPLTTLVYQSSGLGLNAVGGAVDGSGNVYITVEYLSENLLQEWTVTNNTLTTLESSGLSSPLGVAVDGQGNVYFANTSANNVKEWVAASQTLVTLASGLNTPSGIAVDGAGNVYIGESGDIKEWVATNHTLITLVSSGVSDPFALAVDAAGNVYAADPANKSIVEWSAANHTVTTLATGLSAPYGVAVDGAGNVYFSDYNNNFLDEWSAATQTVIPVLPSLENPQGVCVDAAGNIYVVNYLYIDELPRAFVDPTPKVESPGATSDVLPVVLPATENLLAPFAPTNSQPWITITGVTNGVVSFAFSVNTGVPRTNNISLLGENIPVSQAATSIGVTTLLTGTHLLAGGSLQFSFTNVPGATFTVLSSTNVSLPLSNWTSLGAPVEGPPGQYLFTTPATNLQLFYILQSP